MSKITLYDDNNTPAEVEALRKREDFILLEIRAPRELRWERLVERGRTGDAETFEQFTLQEESELVAHDESGQALIATGKMADVVIHNNGNVNDLYKQLDAFMEEHS